MGSCSAVQKCLRKSKSTLDFKELKSLGDLVDIAFVHISKGTQDYENTPIYFFGPFAFLACIDASGEYFRWWDKTYENNFCFVGDFLCVERGGDGGGV